ncbi:hypothetical protein NY547_02510 [Cnuibacter physcomitrellae]|uniref:hypothetical protein n=1 Tax=Cnuibacter physcomitrellae TaxID=1619308 RepID=UPI002175D7FF|nr:hypothetical protein [Cnuibacter physcomitrellae]MCS5496111.1 hypothetical protein [Cnuibacter physcomitrellae]
MEPNPQFISMLDPLVGVRSTVGSCVPGGGAAVVERTADGGATWTRVLVDVLDLRQVLSLDYVADGQISIVGTGADCMPIGLVSFTGGEFWEAGPDQLASASFVEPNDPSKILDRGAEMSAPCSVSELQRAGGTLIALCSDGSVQYRGTDASWIPVGIGDVLVATASGETTLLTASLDPACSGTLFRSVDLATDRVADLACISVLPANATLDVAANSVIFWSGEEVYLSQNGGVTWAAVS